MKSKILLEKHYLILTVALVSLVLGGCSIKFSNDQKDITAGVFKSTDKANTWHASNLFLSGSGTGQISDVNTIYLQFDPEDYNAIYLNSNNFGLLYTYNAASSWQQASSLGNDRIESIAVDSHNKCIIYVSKRNTILKSVDCNRTYDEIYVDTRADKTITSIVVDSYNNLVVYAANNAGDIFKSLNGGSTWQVIYRINRSIKKILINPQDTRIIYVATNTDGIFKTIDAGANWSDINQPLKQYNGAFQLKDLFFDPSLPDSIMLVSKYGLIKSDDGGANWTPYQLITPVNSVDIYAAAINPKNNKEIYYATGSTFYKSVDGGKNWITNRLPSGAMPSVLLIDPTDPSVIYMGMYNPSK